MQAWRYSLRLSRVITSNLISITLVIVRLNSDYFLISFL